MKIFMLVLLNQYMKIFMLTWQASTGFLPKLHPSSQAESLSFETRCAREEDEEEEKGGHPQ